MKDDLPEPAGTNGRFQLAPERAREIFGIPGDFVLPFFKVIEESGILPHYTLSHEPGVGFAADAAARYHAGLGVAVVTYGAGAFNLVNAIAGAYAERSPVVVIAGAPGAGERSSGFGVHHQARSIDTQMAVYREITCDQAVLTNADTAPAEIARVLRSARERSLRDSVSDAGPNIVATELAVHRGRIIPPGRPLARLDTTRPISELLAQLAEVLDERSTASGSSPQRDPNA